VRAALLLRSVHGSPRSTPPIRARGQNAREREALVNIPRAVRLVKNKERTRGGNRARRAASRSVEPPRTWTQSNRKEPHKGASRRARGTRASFRITALFNVETLENSFQRNIEQWPLATTRAVKSYRISGVTGNLIPLWRRAGRGRGQSLFGLLCKPHM